MLKLTKSCIQFNPECQVSSRECFFQYYTLISSFLISTGSFAFLFSPFPLPCLAFFSSILVLSFWPFMYLFSVPLFCCFFYINILLWRRLLQPPKIFKNSCFCPINCTKCFYVIISTSLFMHLLIVYDAEFGDVVWVWGIIKENGREERGVGEIPWLLFCPFLRYLTRYMLQTSRVDENHHFLTYSAKKSCENPMFLPFFGKKLMFVIFHIHFQSIQISEGTLTFSLWRHSDVIYSSMVLILLSMDRGGPYLYTGIKYSVSGILYRKSREGVATIPLRRTRVTFGFIISKVSMTYYFLSNILYYCK